MQDYFYICQGHLKDRGFASPIVDEADVAAKAKKEALDREIESIKKEYEEKLRKNKSKKEEKKKAEKDKEEDKANAKEKKNKDEVAEAEQERDAKVGYDRCPCRYCHC